MRGMGWSETWAVVRSLVRKKEPASVEGLSGDMCIPHAVLVVLVGDGGEVGEAGGGGFFA